MWPQIVQFLFHWFRPTVCNNACSSCCKLIILRLQEGKLYLTGLTSRWSAKDLWRTNLNQEGILSFCAPLLFCILVDLIHSTEICMELWTDERSKQTHCAEDRLPEVSVLSEFPLRQMYYIVWLCRCSCDKTARRIKMRLTLVTEVLRNIAHSLHSNLFTLARFQAFAAVQLSSPFFLRVTPHHWATGA